MDGPASKLELTDGVELQVHRYRLTADHLTLERTPRGIVVDGQGQVAFCPCGSPPIRFGFSRATVAPPTDLLLTNATLRLVGVPVFYTPWLWLRSPNRTGLLPPHFAWRARDGAWAGSGFHLPLSTRSDPSPEFLDVNLGGYLKGGVDLGAQLSTTRTTSALRWDWLEHGFFVADAHGSVASGDGLSLAWRVDALRGRRGLVGPVSFQTATRRYDRARVEATLSGTGAMLSLGGRADAVRGGPYGEFGVVGPTARLGAGTALGEFGTADSSTTLLSRVAGVAPTAPVDGGSSLTPQLRHEGHFGLVAHPGPASLEFRAVEQWLLGSDGGGSFSAARLGSAVVAGLPIRRVWQGSSQPWSHWIEPKTQLQGAVQAGPGLASPLVGQVPVERDGRWQPVGLAALGLSSRLGKLGTEQAYALEGWTAELVRNEGKSQLIWSRLSASGRWWGLGGELGWVQGSGGFSTARSRLGRADRLALVTRLEGQASVGVRDARWLSGENWGGWNRRYFDGPGWTGGGDLLWAVTGQLATFAGLDYDLTSRERLSERLGLSYRHPCGCLSVSALGARRAARDGTDAWVVLDLMP